MYDTNHTLDAIRYAWDAQAFKRKPTRWQRAVKWCQQHPDAVAALVSFAFGAGMAAFALAQL